VIIAFGSSTNLPLVDITADGERAVIKPTPPLSITRPMFSTIESLTSGVTALSTLKFVRPLNSPDGTFDGSVKSNLPS
jgi:hypothetical protein